MVNIKNINTIDSTTEPLGGISNRSESKIPKTVAIKDTLTDTIMVEKKEVQMSSADIGGIAMKDEARISPTAFIAKTMFMDATLTSI